LEEELRTRGIYKLPFQVRGASEFGIRQGYLAMLVQYRDQSQVFPNALDVHDLEYTMTTTISKLSSEKATKVGFFAGQGNEEAAQQLQGLRKLIETEYELEAVDLLSSGFVPEGIAVLLVWNPNRVSEREKYELDQFLMRGGKIIFLLDGVNIVPEYWIAFPKDDNLDDLLKSYGVKRSHDLVMDVLNERVAMRQGAWSIIQEYPLWVKVNIPTLRQLGLAADHPIINLLDSVVLPWTSSLEYEGETSENHQPVALLKTSPKSWVQTGQFKLNPQELPPALPIQGMGEQVRDLAILVTGAFPSFYAGKPIPAAESGDQQTPPTQPPPSPFPRQDQSQKTSILVVGNGRFITDDNLKIGNSNAEFILNSLDWMTVGGKLIDIRSRGTADRPLNRDVSKLRFWTAGLAGPFLVPVGIILFGLARSFARKRMKRRYSETLSGKASS
jgi:gliding-associated putative ABC transporter substrate-binding component GldG